ncbi:MAG: hypothetical protein L0G99_16670, partial [Propionibacteriales bacterium]|nr:hypothetical protein [Propionibacteriales bacterium]
MSAVLLTRPVLLATPTQFARTILLIIASLVLGGVRCHATTAARRLLLAWVTVELALLLWRRGRGGPSATLLIIATRIAVELALLLWRRGRGGALSSFMIIAARIAGQPTLVHRLIGLPSSVRHHEHGADGDQVGIVDDGTVRLV